MCFICEHLIEDISILPCNHYFCKDCIISWINEEEKCPECSEEANTEKIKGATLFINRAFSGFKIKCSLDNCDEFIEYESIKSHETECLEKMIPCEHCEEKKETAKTYISFQVKLHGVDSYRRRVS